MKKIGSLVRHKHSKQLAIIIRISQKFGTFSLQFFDDGVIFDDYRESEFEVLT